MILIVNDKNDEPSKFIGVPACEDKIPKFAAKYCKKHIAKRIILIEKAHLMSYDNKDNFIMHTMHMRRVLNMRSTKNKSNNYQKN